MSRYLSTTLTVIKQAVEELDPSGEQIQVLLITVDPERILWKR